MNGTIKRVTPPDELEIPEGMVYVGMGGEHLRNRERPYCGLMGTRWEQKWRGEDDDTHYCLPADSPLLEPLPRTVNLPAGFPPVPEEGLEVLGRYPELRAGDIYYALSNDGKEWVGPITATLSGIYKAFTLRRPPVAKPQFQTVPFDSVADFGPTFPVWVHYPAGGCAMIDAFGINHARVLRDWKSYKARVELNQRWSTSPLTKWQNARPFTKEVPA